MGVSLRTSTVRRANLLHKCEILHTAECPYGHSAWMPVPPCRHECLGGGIALERFCQEKSVRVEGLEIEITEAAEKKDCRLFVLERVSGGNRRE